MAAKLTDNKTLFCHSDDRKNLIKSRPAQWYFTAVLNLYAFVFCSFCSLSLLYFGSPKVPKGSAQTKIVAYSSARELNLFNIPRSSFACHSNPICFEQGAANNIANELKPNLFEFLQRVQHIVGFAKLAPRGCIRKITPTLRSNSLAQWPALNRDLHSICLAKLLLLGIVQVNLALLSLTRNFLTVPSYLTLLLLVENRR